MRMFSQIIYFFMLFAKFVIEGTTGDGSEGDIAIDDMSVLDGNCKKIIAQGMDKNTQGESKSMVYLQQRHCLA